MHPSLPIEIWSYKIRLATLETRVFNTLLVTRISYRLRSDAKRRRQIKSTKLSVASVSKAWREVAVPFLFESLTVTVYANRCGVGRSKVELPLTLRGPGTPLRHVRHLRVYSGDLPRSEETQGIDYALLALCASACQNLTHLSFSTFSPSSPSLLPLILAERGASLRYLQLTRILPQTSPRFSQRQPRALNVSCYSTSKRRILGPALSSNCRLSTRYGSEEDFPNSSTTSNGTFPTFFILRSANHLTFYPASPASQDA
jgi:hypothetical protein